MCAPGFTAGVTEMIAATCVIKRIMKIRKQISETKKKKVKSGCSFYKSNDLSRIHKI